MSPPHDQDTRLLVLHALRCAGACGTDRIGHVTGVGPFDVESELIDLGAAGLVTRMSRDMPYWSLTDAGRAAAALRIRDELDSAATRDTVAAAYERFLVLNPELLDLCRAWQLRPVDGVLTANDHRDATYDRHVLDLFADLDRRAEPVLDKLTAALPRFGRYRVRFADVLGRARSGELEYVTDSTLSFHTIWAELHEDLLATLGLQR
ncbi:hypothetical protein DSC45_04020 [Streptomyces sp. YIM 130001]|uniref:transcriptional regulator n=1 Tax=Streptomyces sp. YIM 130001 TaxID=2259644 RepID=UPI000E64FACF|nr:transcriptional regulator [Streptomyces sp. YIM 130001]RII20370.1 hypothetical protein DSC45_04020 [Streptomyces sp. YIM 130001]